MWRPNGTDAFPTLGRRVAQQMEELLASPDDSEDDPQPFRLTREQFEFLIRLYELDPVTGARVKHRAVLSRPRGWGKSPFLAAIAIAEGLFDVVFDHWDDFGQPVGKPWSRVRTPLVLVTAVNEDQTGNTWTPLQEMLQNGPIMDDDRYAGIEVFDSFVNLPRGKIEVRTSSARAVKGARAVCAIMDQTEEWVASNGGPNFAQKLRNNATKLGGVTIESPNAYTPGEESVAETSAKYWFAVLAGKAKSKSILYEHREAPADTDPSDMDSLVAGLRVAYGDSSDHPDGCVIHPTPCPPAWSPIHRIALDFWDTANDPQVMRADFLNQITHAGDAWLSQPELKAIAKPDIKVGRSEPITLGFDGSRGRTKGKPDATALVGCRVSDGHLFKLGVWEAPEGPSAKGWRVPDLEVEAAVAEAFRTYNVVGFYADPSMWDGRVAQWEATHNRALKVRVTRESPIAFNVRSISKVVAGFEALHAAIVNGEISYDESYDLTRHFLNARRQAVRSGIVLRKPNDNYLAKIDAAYAAMLAFMARLDALGKGIGLARAGVPRRIY
jgi:hypothetical protein